MIDNSIAYKLKLIIKYNHGARVKGISADKLDATGQINSSSVRLSKEISGNVSYKIRDVIGGAVAEVCY